MSTEFEEATKIIDELVGLDLFEVVQLISENPEIRLYGARQLVPLTVGITPIVIADHRGVRLMESRKDMERAWSYSYEHGIGALNHNPSPEQARRVEEHLRKLHAEFE